MKTHSRVKIPFMDTSGTTLELRSYNTKVQQHHHDHHQLVLPITGVLAMDVAGAEGDVCSQRAAVIAARQEHHFTSTGDNCFVVADITQRLFPTFHHIPAFIELDTAFTHYITFLKAQLEQQKSSLHSKRQMALLLLRLLSERYSDYLTADKRVATAKAYLDQHFSQPVSLSELAVIAHLSSRQLSELFRRELGCTPQQYLTDKRMQRASCLLETSRLSVQQIADQVGYNNLAAFSDRFRKHFGHSPKHFRQLSK
ncbi:MAG: helix-turn-helix domain-containing protein [Thiolinea sp.]